MYTQSTNEVTVMKQIDPIISLVAILIVSTVIGIMSTTAIGTGVFLLLFLVGEAGNKILGDVPNTHD